MGLALSGISSLLLDPEKPQVCGPTIPDNATGMLACHGVLGALYERERTGKGRLVELNMMEAAISFIPDPFANYTLLGIEGGRNGSDLAAPVLGEHTDAVLAELGYREAEIAAKRAAKII